MGLYACCSHFEWGLHRFVMHKPVGPFDYPFRAHALVHHNVFGADKTYHIQREEDKHLIPMAWWNGPVLIMLGSLPFAIISYFIDNWWLTAAAALVITSYYSTYEYLHWCMHLPKSRRLEKNWLFRRINGHHILHHRYMHKNFNVVLPWADLCLGTLRLRALTMFAQVRGPSVPDVQPKMA